MSAAEVLKASKPMIGITGAVTRAFQRITTPQRKGIEPAFEFVNRQHTLEGEPNGHIVTLVDGPVNFHAYPVKNYFGTEDRAGEGSSFTRSNDVVTIVDDSDLYQETEDYAVTYGDNVRIAAYRNRSALVISTPAEDFSKRFKEMAQQRSLGRMTIRQIAQNPERSRAYAENLVGGLFLGEQDSQDNEATAAGFNNASNNIGNATYALSAAMLAQDGKPVSARDPAPVIG